MTRRIKLVRTLLLTIVFGSLAACAQDTEGQDAADMRFQSVSMQYIAALGGEGENSGSGAQAWGLWPVDPGPRGVRLNSYERLRAADGRAPAGTRG